MTDVSQGQTKLQEGKRLLELRRYSKAIYLLQEECVASPSFESWNLLGVAFTALGKYNRAVGAFNKALEIDDSAVAYSNLGLAYYYLKDSANARINYERALDKDKEYPVAMINYAIFLSRLKEYPAAETLFKKALQINDRLFYARLHLGYIYYSEKKYQQALNEFNRGIKINDKNFELYLYRANTYYRLNMLGSAESDLLKAEMLRPNHPKVGILRNLIERRRKYGN